MKKRLQFSAWMFGFVGAVAGAHGETASTIGVSNLLAGNFRWEVSAPLIAPVRREDDPCVSIKDPSVVFHDGRWHVFATIRSKKRTHQIEYLSFASWAEADRAPRHVLGVVPGYFCAPQVFWFAPHQRWYLIYQVNEPSRKPALQPAWSVCERVDQPRAWSKPVLLFDQHPDNVKAWIDFWVICDDTRAHLFFTSNDGRMWRAETLLHDFPRGWSRPAIVLEGDIFEASHTYALKGLGKFLTLIEAQDKGRRYYKAYLADRLDGEWRPLAATREKPFAGLTNTIPLGTRWTESFSHGELLRLGIDHRLEVDPSNLRFLFQGVSDAAREGKPYGEIPWRLGILEPR
jgi:hypothetical protein